MSEQTKEKLISVAGPFFAELGYEGTGVRAICKAAGLSQVAVNYHFGSKENLYKACVEKCMCSETAEQFYDEFPVCLDQSIPAEQRLLHLLETSMDCFYYKDIQWHDLLILREMLRPSKCCEEILKEAFAKESEVIQGILSELLPESTPDEVLVKFQMSIFGQAYMYSLSQSMLPWLVDADKLEEGFTGKKIAAFIHKFSMAAIREYCETSGLDESVDAGMGNNWEK